MCFDFFWRGKGDLTRLSGFLLAWSSKEWSWGVLLCSTCLLRAQRMAMTRGPESSRHHYQIAPQTIWPFSMSWIACHVLLPSLECLLTPFSESLWPGWLLNPPGRNLVFLHGFRNRSEGPVRYLNTLVFETKYKCQGLNLWLSVMNSDQAINRNECFLLIHMFI